MALQSQQKPFFPAPDPHVVFLQASEAVYTWIEANPTISIKEELHPEEGVVHLRLVPVPAKLERGTYIIRSRLTWPNLNRYLSHWLRMISDELGEPFERMTFSALDAVSISCPEVTETQLDILFESEQDKTKNMLGLTTACHVLLDQTGDPVWLRGDTSLQDTLLVNDFEARQICAFYAAVEFTRVEIIEKQRHVFCFFCRAAVVLERATLLKNYEQVHLVNVYKDALDVVINLTIFAVLVCGSNPQCSKSARVWLENVHPAVRATVLKRPSICLFRQCANPACALLSKEKILQCGRCRRNYYCSQECQRQDWPVHRLACRERDNELIKK